MSEGLDEAKVRAFFEAEIRPKVRVDGGDVTVSGVSGREVHVTAHADCSVCPATDCGLSWWIEKACRRQFGAGVTVKIEREPPYYYQA